MAVGAYFNIREMEPGPAVAGRFLGQYFDTIRGMNEADIASKARAEGDDVAALDKLEMAARERLAQMATALQEAKSGDFKSTNDLAKTYLTLGSEERRTAMQESGANARKMWEISSEYRDRASRENEELRKRVAVKDENAAKIADFAKIANNPGTTASGIVEQLRGILQAEQAGNPSDPKYVSMVADAYDALIRAGPVGARYADEVRSALLPEAARKDQLPGDYFMENFAPESLKSAQEAADAEFRKHRGGGARGSREEDLARMGLSPEEIANRGGVSVGESTRVKGPAGGGESAAPTRDGGSVSVSGMSPAAAQAFTAATAAGKDPYAAMNDAVAAQAAYIAELGQRRKAAMNRPKTSLYPRPNIYTVSPNRYVDDRTQRAVRAVGGMDPGQAEEWATGLTRNDGSIRRTYAEIGDVPRRYGADEFEPAMMEKGGDLGDALSNMRPEEWAGVLGKQPAEVRSLFEGALNLAQRDPRGAMLAARQVTEDDVRAAYGEALVRASHDDRAVEEVVTGLMALPESAGGPWRDAAYRVVDDYRAAVPAVGDERAADTLQASFRSLGNAMVKSTVTKDKRARREVAEVEEKQADEKDLAAFKAGEKAVLDALDLGHDYESIGFAWDKAPDSPTKRGAWSALEQVSSTGPETLRHKVTKEIGPAPAEQTYSVRPPPIVKTPDVTPEPTVEADPFAKFATGWSEEKPATVDEEDPFVQFAKEYK